MEDWMENLKRLEMENGYNCAMTVIGDRLRVKRYGLRINPEKNRLPRTRLPRRDRPVSEEERSREMAPRERDAFETLVEANFVCEDLFLTLTFEREETTLEEAGEDFENWVKRMRDRFSDFRYVAVRSFQKRGTPHFHVLMSRPNALKKRLTRGELEPLWGQGRLDVRAVKDLPRLTRYLMKNLKEFKADSRSYRKRLYLKSLNLTDSTPIKGDYRTLMNALRESGVKLVNESYCRFPAPYLDYVEKTTYRIESLNVTEST